MLHECRLTVARCEHVEFSRSFFDFSAVDRKTGSHVVAQRLVQFVAVHVARRDEQVLAQHLVLQRDVDGVRKRRHAVFFCFLFLLECDVTVLLPSIHYTTQYTYHVYKFTF